ncbi:copper amine oxidase N-terminal domain-containing protein [Paenibacillus sp.]|uniref:copper amine oxidase N-terminal domain-containing protein n=1 Tax=Paenibacillus sp. TaxID=58172 RepID=UPI002D6F8881|nr:copper amine oxidase N-terminal domain-containing protein [Paenibacillus sp.]HZG84852.1 copper amine oxidase N-terminal domain-containing protein [Paenibacillus sp.]
MTKVFTFLLSVVVATLLLPFSSQPIQAEAGSGALQWGEVKTGIYQPLHPYTLNWSGNVLDRGGFALSEQRTTAEPTEADFVINQYGAIGAASILKLPNEPLTASTSRDLTGFTNSYTLAAGDIYLVMLSDGRYAKLQIDRLSPENGSSYQSVSFSYVLEREAAAPSTITPVQEVPPAVPKPESAPTQPPVAPTPAPVSKGKSSITLTIGQNSAIVQGKQTTLQAPPAVVNGTTLVPFRFLAEALGAEVKWDGAEQKISLTSGTQTIELWINKPTAMINGVSKKLDVPPRIIGQSTLVPLRFISENFNQQVQFDQATGSITISGELAAALPNQTSVQKPAQGQGFVVSMFGNWDVRIKESSASDPQSGSLSIYQDGTYAIKMRHQGEYAGVWSIAKENEVENNPSSLILHRAMEEADWAVVPLTEGKIELLRKGAYSNNALYNTKITVYWIPTYEGVKASDNPDQIDQFATKEYDFTSFVGNYDLWIEGGATNLYYKDTGNYATHEYNPGADGGTLTIHADGTYTFKTKTTVSGKWRPSKVNEVYGYEYSIILENGPDGINWSLLYNGNGKTMVAYDAGKWADGSAMWLPYYIASLKK